MEICIKFPFHVLFTFFLHKTHDSFDLKLKQAWWKDFLF